ncbi:wd40 repeat family [Anaeramoeba flamelloides]|uniref:Wd40 repeat family n=1 Tax=Anaeramoeba flamelloides TaxID=1746091 RepID=A0AAV7YEI1_9EUKA|nr:wd40 repeat family [Anaeramoeba flamelloides]
MLIGNNCNQFGPLCLKYEHKEIIENIDHFLWVCPSYKKDRLIILKKLKELNFNEIILNYDGLKLFSLINNREIYDFTLKFLKGNLKTKKIVKIKTTPHESEVNRVSINPKNNDILATKAGNNSIYIFMKEDDEYKYKYTCSGHKNEGYGISWNPYHPELLLSGSYDSLICIWDINKPNSTKINPLKTYSIHSKDIEDVQWHPFNGNVFGSVADDKTLKIFDIREEKPTIDIKAHDEEVNSIAFNPDNQHFLLTASSDKTIRLWDLRKIEKSLHTFKSHKDKVYKVCWNPHYPTTFASSGDDKRIHIWDINKIGDEKKKNLNHNNPTELVFTNYGHRAVIRDFCWSPTIPWALSSIDDNSLNQIWRVKKKSIFKEKNILTATEIEF